MPSSAPHSSAEELTQERLGYYFRDPDLLVQALTHSSAAHEREGFSVGHNERLEFLGDSILDMLIAEELFHQFPHLREGMLTQRRARMVSSQGLLQVAQRLGLGECLLLGRGEEKSGGRDNPNILSDALEAIIAAIYLDGGMNETRAVVLRLFRDELLRESDDIPLFDFMSRLQEYTQAVYQTTPYYRVVAEDGPAHDRCFHVTVLLMDEPVGCGVGRNKKQAKQDAARDALIALEVIDCDTERGPLDAEISEEPAAET